MGSAFMLQAQPMSLVPWASYLSCLVPPWLLRMPSGLLRQKEFLIINQEDHMDNTHKPKPVHTIREHDVKAAIWLNQAENAQYYNITLSRMFVDSENNHKDTSSFGLHDLTKVEMVLKKARQWMMDEDA